MHRNKSVNVHQFSMVPRADIPRSSFRIQTTHKTTFDAGYLVPIYVDEILPGDTFSLKMTAFCRMSTPLFPLMDNLHLDSFFFFVPYRLLWDNWVRFMGEQDNPADSISYVFPFRAANTGYAVGSVMDYMGLPTVGQVTGATVWNHATLPLRAYNLIWNQWFRDENLQNSVIVRKTDGGDQTADWVLLRRGKRHDYFTSCLPWTQKSAVAVTLPLGTSATVKSQVTELLSGAQAPIHWRGTTTGANPTAQRLLGVATTGIMAESSAGTYTPAGESFYPSNLYADLSTATAATINQLRQSFQIQRLLERDARGGTRYTELTQSHFGVRSPDARLQRPEYLGGGSTAININPIAQTGQTGLTGGTTPIGTLAAFATGLSHGQGFSQSFTEHGVVLGLVSVRADLTYQQGLRKMWSRSSKYDFYFPAFAHLGEQAVLNKEIYLDGSANMELVFGYQERWAELRHHPSRISGLFKSTSAGTIDPWHAAQRFTVLPTLNATFIEDTPPISRIVAVGAGANGQQFLFDSFFDIKAARPLPLYSVPGMIDHF